MRKFYVNFFTVFCILLFTTITHAQLTGTKTIPGDYATVAAAATDLNALGVGAGGVIFNVAASHTEISDVPVITASGTAVNTIIFQKSGLGANPKITPLTGGTVTSTTTLGSHGDGIIVINGGDYITFDGIDLETNAAFTSVAMYEYGYYLKKASATDACKNITIKNCAITLNKATIFSFGIFVSNISGLLTVTVTATGGRSENIKIFGNTISNAYGGVQLRGFAAAAPYDFYDQNIEVGAEGANVISNFGGGASTAYGVYSIYQNNLKINNNSITGGDNTTTTHYGIFCSTSNNANIDIDNNTISLTNHSTTSQVTAIALSTGTVGTTNTQNIRNNTISNFNRPAATTGATYFIYFSTNYPQNLTITGNTISNSTLPGTGAVFGIYNISNPENLLIANNTIHSITRAATSSTTTFYGINSDNAAATTQTTISGNTIHSLTGNGSSGVVGGITVGTQTTVNIFKNKIYNLTSDNAAGVVYGMTLGTGVTTYNVFNNLVGDLKAPNTSSTSDAIRGINITSTTANSNINLSYNSVYLSATSAGANFTTTGIYHSTSATATSGTLNMRNNLVVNSSTPNGTGLAIAYRRSSTTLTNYGSASNNNSFYAGIPSATNVIFYDGTNSDQALVDYKARVAPRDANSYTENAPFISTVGTNAAFLHINPATPTQLESGGIPVTGITDDFDADTRNVTTPDIGADEFTGTSADLAAPVITYTPLPTACGIGNRTLSGVTITDASGVATAGALVPRIYYRKNAGAWFSQPGTLASGTGTNGVWDFTIVSADMGGVILEDLVSYFIIAQDLAGTPNIGSNPTGVIATNVNTVTTPPSSPESYFIGMNLGGNYSIGASATFKTLTNAVEAYNGCPVTGPVVFNLVDAIYSTNETFPITIKANPAASALNTLSIQPQLGTNVTITGTSGTTPAALIRLNGAKYVTIDGLNTAGNNLVIENTSTSAGSAVIWLSSNGAGAGATNNTIRNTTIKAGVTQNTATTVTYGIVIAGSTLATSVGSTTAGEDNDNNLVQENLITKVRYGLYVRGGSASNPNTGTIINGNTFGPTAFGTESIGKSAILIREELGTQITGNTIQFIGGDYANTSGGTDRVGIALGTDGAWPISTAFVKNAVITDNIIHDIVDERTLAAAGIALGGLDGANATNNLVANNMISNIKANGTVSDQAVGIGLSGGNGDRVVYNSIYMTGDMDPHASATTPTTSSFGISVSSVTNVTNPEIADNIVHMDLSSSSAPALKNAAINVPASFVWGTGRSNYNDLYATTTNTQAVVGAVGGSAGTFYTTLADWQGAVSQDANSLSTVPVFVSATDLHLVPASNGIINNQGTPLPGITTDIDGDTRSATNPDMGADEFVGPAVDVTPPNIVFTNLSDTCSPGNRNLQATITDLTGVPVSGPLQPRIYYRKNAGTWFSSQGVLASGTGNNGSWNFTIIAADMGGLAFNDVVQYFVIAQDLVNNVASRPSAGLVATDVNSITTAPTSPESFTVLPNLNGTYTVGAGGNYTTLTAAINAYNNFCVTGPVVFELTDATYSAGETYPITINQNVVASATNTLTIRPAAGVAVVVTGSSASGALIDLNGADYVTINGVNAGGSSLIIRNTSTTIPVIRFINDATHNTITNSIIEGSVTSTTNGQIVFSTAASGTSGNSNNTISNSVIRDRTDATAAFAVAIYSSGTASVPNSSNTISGNNIYNFSGNGVNLVSTGIGNGWQVVGNSFYNNLATAPALTQTSILISGGSSHSITGNFIGGQSPNAGGGPWTNSGSVTFAGINLAGVGSGGAVSVQDNTIQNIRLTATGSSPFNGITITGASTANVGTVTGNTIGHPTNANSIQVAGSSTTMGINSSSSGVVVFSNNLISNITSTGVATSVGVRGISHTGSGLVTITNNTIQQIAGSAATTSNATSALLGIYTSSGSVGQQINGNIIRSLVLSHPTAVNYVQAINLNSAETGLGTVSGNLIYDIQNTSSGTPNIIGIDLLTGSWNIVNNMVSITNATNTNSVRIIGIWDWPGTTYTGNNYFNSVNIGGSAAAGAGKSFAYLRSDGGTSSIRNNIFHNERSGGTGAHIAIADENTSAGTLLSSNYNDLFATNPATVGEWGTGINQTFAQWQSSSAGDANSISVLPVFNSNSDLHLVTGVNPLINNAGTPVAGVTTDFDNETRNVTTPDIGADEFTPSVSTDFSALDLTEPIVKNCYSNAETVKVTIRNNSGAVHDFSLLPVTVNVSVTGPNPVTFTPVIVNTGSLAAGGTLEVQISSNYDMTAAGTYTFNASTQVAGDINTGNDAMTAVTRTVTALTAGTLITSNSSYCVTTGTPTLTLVGVSTGSTIQWQQSTTSTTGPWTNVGTSTNTFTPATPVTATTWYQALVSCATNTVTSNTVTVTFNNPQVLSTIAGSICVSGAVTLEATGSPGTTLNWYNVATGGTALASGTSFTTPTLNTTTTYFVEAASGSGIITAGRVTPFANSTGFNGTNYGMVFTATQPFTLNSVDVYPTTATGSITVQLRTSGGTVLQTAGPFTLPAATGTTFGNGATPFTLNLNFAIPIGTDLRLVASAQTGSIIRDNPISAVFSYPLPIGSVGSITAGLLSGSPNTNTHYYFYNWKLLSGCVNPVRTQVEATVYPTTVGGTVSPTQTICVGNTPADIILSGHTGSVIKWQRSSNASFTSPVDIAVTSATLTGTQIGPLAATTYFRAVVQSGICAPENSSVVTITVANPTATIAYTNSPYCFSAGTAAVNFTGTMGGNYSASPTGLSINSSTGAITLGSSTAGTYTVTYSIAASSGCPAFSTSTSVTISSAGTWLGVTSTDWNTASNWCGGIPGSTTDVTIPSVAPNMPNLSGGAGTVRNLSISNGGSVTVGTGGILDLYGNISGAGTFTATNGSISFRGSANQATPGISATNITMNGSGGWTPGANSTITGQLTLTNGNITIGNNNLSLQNSSIGSIASHIIINGTGRVGVSNLAASNIRVVPIGSDAGSYNPVTLLANTGHTTDNFTIGVRQGVFVNGSSGTTFTTHVVDRMWSITESTAGGSNVNVTLQWTAGQELTSFNRAKSYVMQHNGSSWVTAPETAAGGNDPYTQTKLSVTSFGSFAVQTQPIPRPVTGIYPNPTRSQLNVVIDLPAAQKVTLTVFDAAGKLVKQYATNLNIGLNLYPMQVYDLSAGVYFIKVSISSNPEFMLTRFVKE